jgi:ribosomal protein S18 acetylase RimI-like enzyme
MNISLHSPINAEQLARFIEKMNTKQSTHVGYCGEEKNEILDALLNDFSDKELEDSFIVAYKEDRIVGAVGFDIDIDEKTAEVWGPFLEDGERWDDLAVSIWQQASILLRMNDIKSVSFFLNQFNTVAIQFVSLLKGVCRGKHLILKASRKNHQLSNEHQKVSSVKPEQKSGFLKLHKQSFPNTYYHGDYIWDKLSDENQLLTAVAGNDDLAGYVYIEASPKHGEGRIEYIAVSKKHRKKGVGALLVKAALNRLFEHSSINEIVLCVNEENKKAVNLYTAAGFDVQQEMMLYQVQVR